mgnify:CR=1 FL=1
MAQERIPNIPKPKNPGCIGAGAFFVMIFFGATALIIVMTIMAGYIFNQNRTENLPEMQKQLSAEFAAIKQLKLTLDLTRGKPGTKQVELSNELDGILKGNFVSDDGTDVRNYGGIDGLPGMKQFAADFLQVDASNIIVGGNSSLTLMYQYMFFKNLSWQKQGEVKFLCPVPGYDRHFTICENLNIKMINVNLAADGPDMDQVEELVKGDPSIKGIWCVPKHSNPTGTTYSDDVVNRIASLAKTAGDDFTVMWDNAYAVHDLSDNVKPLASIWDVAAKLGTQDSIGILGSTSKITFAGAGIAFLGATRNNLDNFKKYLGVLTIGPDKANQLRHLKFLKDQSSLKAHMKKHAGIIKPNFDTVLSQLEANLSGGDYGEWTVPEGGYFISFDTKPGLAKEVVKMAAEAGVKL